MRPNAVRLPIAETLDAIPTLLDCYRNDRRVDVINYGTARIVCVAGTDSFDDVINGLRVRMVPEVLTTHSPAKGARVHVGMQDTFLACKSALVQASLDAEDLVIVGHSMGASLACFLAYALVTDYGFLPERIEVVCLGMPRVGNAAWSKAYDAANIRTFRVEHELDPVTCLPPPWGWRHVGMRLRLREDGSQAGPWWFAFMLYAVYALSAKSIKLRGHNLYDYRAVILAATAKGNI